MGARFNGEAKPDHGWVFLLRFIAADFLSWLAEKASPREESIEGEPEELRTSKGEKLGRTGWAGNGGGGK